MQKIQTWFRGFLPEPINVNRQEKLRACIGALLGIILTGYLAWLTFGASSDAILLIAPMGASAVLLFAVPSSPLAQPWSILGGNIIAASIGVSCALLSPHVLLAAGLAVSLSIAAMLFLRCLHPPSGAVALTAVVGGADIHAQGYAFVLNPVALNSILLLIAAIVFNNLTKRPYPHKVRPTHKESEGVIASPAPDRFGFTTEDLNEVLREYNQVLDVSREDLETLFQQTEMHAYQRRFGALFCRDIMSRNVVSAEFGTPLDEAWALLRKYNIKALPVIDRARRVIGIVTPVDFMKHADLEVIEGFDVRLKRFLQRVMRTHSEKPEVVGQIMSSPVVTAQDDLHVMGLMPLMSEHDLHHIPVLDDERRLVGIVTQSDFVNALYYRRLDTPPPERSEQTG